MYVIFYIIHLNKNLRNPLVNPRNSQFAHFIESVFNELSVSEWWLPNAIVRVMHIGDWLCRLLIFKTFCLIIDFDNIHLLYLLRNHFLHLGWNYFLHLLWHYLFNNFLFR